MELYKESGKIKNKKQVLFIWPDAQGDSSFESHAWGAQERFCSHTVFYLHILWLSQNKNIHDKYFPKFMNIFYLLLIHVLFCPGGSSVVPSAQEPQCYGWSVNLAGHYGWWTSSSLSYTMGIEQFHRPVVFEE